MDRETKLRTLALLREKDRRAKAKEKAERLRGDFAAFVRESWHVVEPAMALIDNWHIDALAEHLAAVARGQIRFLMINIGPGYAKSLIGSVQFSAWLWTLRPAERIIAATYATKLTTRDSIRTRDLLASEWYQDTFSPSWELVKSNEDYISNSTSGFRLALSVGSAATGFRGNGQIFDDLLNASDKHSEAARDQARDWAMSTMSTRFNDMRNGWRVCIGQRLHELDPYGAMLATGEYVHLCLPSEFEPERRCSTSIGWTDPRNEAGELLFPELFTVAVLEKAKRDLGSYDYAGQHQQRPAPAEGGIVKRDWWQTFSAANPPQFDAVVVSVDATFKDSESSDYVAIHAYGVIGPRSYLIDRVHEKMGYGATKQATARMASKHQARAVLIEDKANGPAIISELKTSVRGVIAITPKDSKVARAWACSTDVEAGNVLLPEDSQGVRLPWAQDVVEEWAVFPNGAHDDDVDAMTQFLNWRRTRAVADTVYGSCFTDDLQYDDAWLEANNPGLRNAGGHQAKYISCHYGTNNQMALLVVIDDGNTLWFDDEVVWDALVEFRQKAAPEYLADLNQLLAKMPNAEVVVNPEALSFQSLLVQNGLWCSTGGDDVLEGIRRFSGLMTQGRVRFNIKCVTLIAQLQSYTWDETAAKKGEDKPSSGTSHAANAARMLVETKLPDWRLL